jgi:hypothetical protein
MKSIHLNNLYNDALLPYTYSLTQQQQQRRVFKFKTRYEL